MDPSFAVAATPQYITRESCCSILSNGLELVGLYPELPGAHQSASGMHSEVCWTSEIVLLLQFPFEHLVT